LRSGLFSGAVTSPRVWNGTLYYFTQANVPSFTTWTIPGCAGSAGTPSLSAAGLPGNGAHLGGALLMETKYLASSSSPAALLIGASRERYGSMALPYDLSSIGMLSCHLFVSIDTWLPFFSTGSPVLPVPGNLSLLGREVFVQAYATVLSFPLAPRLLI
jgi:hypothetical protein